MELSKEITLYIEGLSESEKEKLLSVLVLAEMRLKSSWVLQEHQEGVDVCLCKAHGVPVRHPGPVICHTEPGTNVEDKAHEGVFTLWVDENGVPPFSAMVNVFNQVDAWLSSLSDTQLNEFEVEAGQESPSGDEPEAPSAAEPGQELATELVTRTDAHITLAETPGGDESPSGGSDDEVSPEAAALAGMDIPTLEPVMDELPLAVEPDPRSIQNALSESWQSNRKRPWLGRITEYIQSLDGSVLYHKILLQSGEVILLDLDQEIIYSSVKLESFLDGKGDNNTSYISAMDRQDFIAELNRQDYLERPLSNLRWFLALFSGVSSLDIDMDSQAYKLTGWPETDLPGLHRGHLKLAAFMLAKRESVAEISAETGIAVDLIRSFVEACYFEGLIQTDNASEPTRNSAPKKSKGFWSGVLRKIKW